MGLRKKKKTEPTVLETRDVVSFYRERKQWRWRRVAPNGEVVGASHESYKNFGDALDNLNRQRDEFKLNVAVK